MLKYNRRFPQISLICSDLRDQREKLEGIGDDYLKVF
jgi:hypothetical protein